MFISQDPIGLAGNNPNIYAYVKDTNIWIDTFGLDCFKNNPKKKVNSANVGDIVRTPTTHRDDFVPVKSSRNLKNTNTGEIWQKSFTNHSHSDGGEWKVAIGKSSPTPSKKITVSKSGTIIKFNK